MWTEWDRQDMDGFEVMTRQQVRALDRWAIDTLGVPGVVLMENAGRSCCEVILTHFADACRQGVCVFCGTGNNGGDGFVIARHLATAGAGVKIVLCGDPSKIAGDAKVNYDIAGAMGLTFYRLEMTSANLCRDVETLAGDCGLMVDALFGTGVSGALKEPAALLISAINSHNRPIVAVDIPSGLDCDTGLGLPVCIEAAATVTFAAIKQGFAANPDSRQATGRVFVADIGITNTFKM